MSNFTSYEELLCSELRNSRVREPKVGVSAVDEVGVVIEDVVVVVELQVGVVDSIIIVLNDHMTVMRSVTAEIRSSNLAIFGC